MIYSSIVSLSESAPDLGPQYSGDTPFSKKMRRHQSWYRACVLHLPFGTGPGPNDARHLGNMLTRMDGEKGRNFLTPGIFEVVLERIKQGGGAVEPYRLLHNLLSSQPMCFNLFGPLARDHDLAKRLLAGMVPEKIAEVTRIEFEWAPQPKVSYLADRTAFDAFIEYRTEDGRLVGLGIETKLAEPFSRQVYDRPEYRRWMQLADSPWRPDSWDKVQDIRYNQLWRDHLLTVALGHHADPSYDITRLMLVHHPDDSESAKNFNNYKRLLRDDDDSLVCFLLDRIIDLWLSVAGEGEVRNWLLAFKMRYIDL